jgi:hypothetical protein
VLPTNVKSSSRGSENSEQESANANDALEAIHDRAQLIAERAYALWENDGRPDGRDQEYWFRAEAELKTERRS